MTSKKQFLCAVYILKMDAVEANLIYSERCLKQMVAKGQDRQTISKMESEVATHKLLFEEVQMGGVHVEDIEKHLFNLGHFDVVFTDLSIFCVKKLVSRVCPRILGMVSPEVLDETEALFARRGHSVDAMLDSFNRFVLPVCAFEHGGG